MAHHSTCALPLICSLRPAAIPDETPTSVTAGVSMRSVRSGRAVLAVTAVRSAPSLALACSRCGELLMPSEGLMAVCSPMPRRALSAAHAILVHTEEPLLADSPMMTPPCWASCWACASASMEKPHWVPSVRWGCRETGCRLNFCNSGSLFPCGHTYTRAKPRTSPVAVKTAARPGRRVQRQLSRADTVIFVRSERLASPLQDGFSGEVPELRLRLNHGFQLLNPGVEAQWPRTGKRSCRT